MCPRCGMYWGCSCSEYQIREWAEEKEPFIEIETPAHDIAENYIEDRIQNENQNEDLFVY